jgi:Sec-independent protein translocase protein TatA
MTALFGFGSLSLSSVVILLLVGALLFGHKLPDIGKSIGKFLAELRGGMKGIEEEIDSGYTQPRYAPSTLEAPVPPQRVPTAGPKFDDSTAIQQAPAVQTQPAPQH